MFFHNNYKIINKKDRKRKANFPGRISFSEIGMKRKYLSTTTIYQDSKERLSEIERLKQQIEKRTTKYPPGKIHIIKTRGNVQFYLRNDPTDKSSKYIPKKEEKKIRQYLQKKYDEESLQLINQEISVLEKFLLKSKVTSTTIQNLYSSQPQEIKNMIIPIDLSDDDFALEWASIPYLLSL